MTKYFFKSQQKILSVWCGAHTKALVIVLLNYRPLFQHKTSNKWDRTDIMLRSEQNVISKDLSWHTSMYSVLVLPAFVCCWWKLNPFLASGLIRFVTCLTTSPAAAARSRSQANNNPGSLHSEPRYVTTVWRFNACCLNLSHIAYPSCIKMDVSPSLLLSSFNKLSLDSLG